MPTSKRRKPKPQPGSQPRSRSRAHRSQSSAHRTWERTRADMPSWLPVMLAADRAEALGDAGQALQIIAGRPMDGEGEVFWRPERMLRLGQLVTWGPLLPRWVTSRWILAQAAQFLSETTRSAHLRALDLAVAARGVPDSVRADQAGWHRGELSTDVMDHDWIHRQLLLYDLGGVRDFLRHGATPDLVAGADRIEEWATTPMGGYEYLEQESDSILWRDLATGSHVFTPNIGSAALLLPGEHVIGRCVPVWEGRLFESAPLQVPREAAEAVAAGPADWLEILATHTSEAVPEERRVMTGARSFDLLTDVPPVVVEACGGPAMVLPALLGLLPDEPGSVPVAPVVAAVLSDPWVLSEVVRRLEPAERDALEEYAEGLPVPWADLCRLAVEELVEAP